MAISALYTQTLYSNGSSSTTYGRYFTTTVDVGLPANNYWIRCSLSWVEGNTQGPPGMGCGLMKYWHANGNMVDNGPNVRSWPSNFLTDFSRVTFACSALRGDARGDLSIFI